MSSGNLSDVKLLPPNNTGIKNLNGKKKKSFHLERLTGQNKDIVYISSLERLTKLSNKLNKQVSVLPKINSHVNMHTTVSIPILNDHNHNNQLSHEYNHHLHHHHSNETNPKLAQYDLNNLKNKQVFLEAFNKNRKSKMIVSKYLDDSFKKRFEILKYSDYDQREVAFPRKKKEHHHHHHHHRHRHRNHHHHHDAVNEEYRISDFDDDSHIRMISNDTDDKSLYSNQSNQLYSTHMSNNDSKMSIINGSNSNASRYYISQMNNGNSKARVTINDEKISVTPSFGSTLSKDAQFALMKTLEDTIVKEIELANPELANKVPRTTTAKYMSSKKKDFNNISQTSNYSNLTSTNTIKNTSNNDSRLSTNPNEASLFQFNDTIGDDLHESPMSSAKNNTISTQHSVNTTDTQKQLKVSKQIKSAMEILDNIRVNKKIKQKEEITVLPPIVNKKLQFGITTTIKENDTHYSPIQKFNKPNMMARKPSIISNPASKTVMQKTQPLPPIIQKTKATPPSSASSSSSDSSKSSVSSVSSLEKMAINAKMPYLMKYNEWKTKWIEQLENI